MNELKTARKQTPMEVVLEEICNLVGGKIDKTMPTLQWDSIKNVLHLNPASIAKNATIGYNEAWELVDANDLDKFSALQSVFLEIVFALELLVDHVDKDTFAKYVQERVEKEREMLDIVEKSREKR